MFVGMINTSSTAGEGVAAGGTTDEAAQRKQNGSLGRSGTGVTGAVSLVGVVLGSTVGVGGSMVGGGDGAVDGNGAGNSSSMGEVVGVAVGDTASDPAVQGTWANAVAGGRAAASTTSATRRKRSRRRVGVKGTQSAVRRTVVPSWLDRRNL
jgi:hypothetical protein